MRLPRSGTERDAGFSETSTWLRDMNATSYVTESRVSGLDSLDAGVNASVCFFKWSSLEPIVLVTAGQAFFTRLNRLLLLTIWLVDILLGVKLLRFFNWLFCREIGNSGLLIVNYYLSWCPISGHTFQEAGFNCFSVRHYDNRWSYLDVANWSNFKNSEPRRSKDGNKCQTKVNTINSEPIALLK